MHACVHGGGGDTLAHHPTRPRNSTHTSLILLPSPLPRLPYFRHTDGRLRILSDPDSYVARLNQEAAALAERARRAAAEAQAAELAECSFNPAVHPAPEYVSRIAQSMALARSVKPPPAPARPDWR